MEIIIKDLYLTSHNEQVKEITLKNDHIAVSFINFGASITKFIDLKSKLNIVLAYDDVTQYEKNPAFLGCVIGRNAGRIENGVITIDGIAYELTKNMKNIHQLHGGFNGFHQKYYDVEIKEDKITFLATSPDLEDGFPGSVTLSVTYTIIENELHIEYNAKTSKKTILNFTNHSYFNLNGNYQSSIYEDLLEIPASEYYTLTSELIPIKPVPVHNTKYDFRRQRAIEYKYDDLFLLKSSDFRHTATLTSPTSPLQLEVYSDQNVLVLYTTGNKENKNTYFAVCLEMEGKPFYEDNLYSPSEEYTQHTMYKLSHQK